jgi:hypothetical protein
MVRLSHFFSIGQIGKGASADRMGQCTLVVPARHVGSFCPRNVDKRNMAKDAKWRGFFE